MPNLRRVVATDRRECLMELDRMNQERVKSQRDSGDEATRINRRWAEHEKTKKHFIVADEPEVMTWEVQGVRIQCQYGEPQGCFLSDSQ